MARRALDETGHIPAVIAHDPLFVLRNWWKMLSHTFRGSSIKSMLAWKAIAKLSSATKSFAARSGILVAGTGPFPPASSSVSPCRIAV